MSHGLDQGKKFLSSLGTIRNKKDEITCFHFVVAAALS